MSSFTQPQQNIDPKTIEKALKSLLKWHKKHHSKSQNNEDYIYLILNLKKIPQKSRTNAYKIPLPHAIHDPKTSKYCLIVHDSVNKSDMMKKIEQEKISVSNVIKLGKLKRDYKTIDDKRKLCRSYDVFFADKRVVRLLPKVLGRWFYKKRKVPVPIDLGRKDWRGEIESVCRSGMLYLRTGTCCVVKVGRVSMRVDEIVENVVEGICGVADIVPSKWGNVRSFHLKLLESLALPVYQGVPDVGVRIEGMGQEGNGKVEDESGNLGERNGELGVGKCMDWDDNVDSVEDDFDGENSEGEGLDLGKLLDKMRKTGGRTDADQKDKMKLLNR